MLHRNTVNSKEWKLVFCLKSLSGGQTASTLLSHLSKWGTAKCCKLDISRGRLDASCELFTRDFSCVWHQRPKFSVLPISPTIIHLDGGWSLKWPPCKPLPCWTSRAHTNTQCLTTAAPGLCRNPALCPQSHKAPGCLLSKHKSASPGSTKASQPTCRLNNEH